jgi:uncharacterized protein involved in exopolysaccharide biosynthesis
MMDRRESTNSLRELAYVVFRHRGKVALCFFGVTLAVTGYTVLSPRLYRSQAKLFVRLVRENAMLDATATVGQAPVVAVPLPRENEISTAVEILNSRVLLEKVVDALGPQAILKGTGLPPPGATEAVPPVSSEEERYRAVERLTKRLTVEPIKKSNVFSVAYDGPSPEAAQAVVAKLVSFFLERHIELNRSPGAHHFLAEQTARCRAEVTRAEEQLRDLKTETGLIAPEVQRQVLVNRLGRLQDELLQTTSTLAATEAEVRLLREKLAGLTPMHVTARTKGIRNEAVENMRGQLYALQMRELESTLKYPEGHPDLQRVHQQAAAARDILRREEQEREQLTEGPNRIYEETELALLKEEPVLASLRAKVESLKAQWEQQRAECKSLNENILRLTRLEREFGLQESHYRRYAENLEQSQIDRALAAERISNVSVVQPATYDIEPVQPRLLVNFGLGLCMALLGSVGLSVQLDRRETPLKTAKVGGQQPARALPESTPGRGTAPILLEVGTEKT